MSYFNIGGNSGTALAPVLATPVVLWLGLEGGALLALPALVAALALARSLGYLRAFVPERAGGRHPGGEDRIGAAALLVAIIILRSVAWFALLTFVPLWAVSLGDSEGEANRLLAVMLVAGAVGTLALGPISDRIGHRRTLLLAQAALAPLMLVFVQVGGVPGAFALALVGACVVGTFGVTMVLSQQYLPQHVGVAGGLSVGFGIGVGGIAAVALGAVADAVDLRTALLVAAAAPALGTVLCLLLPGAPASRPLAAEAAAP
jgi:FSR family fosmidomycin resistance protein-like MFS transporter